MYSGGTQESSKVIVAAPKHTIKRIKRVLLWFPRAEPPKPTLDSYLEVHYERMNLSIVLPSRSSSN